MNQKIAFENLFEFLFVDKEVTDLRMLEQIQKTLPDLQVQWVNSMEEITPFVDASSKKSEIQSGKKILYLNNYKGEVVKFCPAKSPGDYLCCNLHTVNLMSNCVYNCAYCILQACLTNPVMQVHCNLDEIFRELEELDSKVGSSMRICTGEIADSLALDPVLNQAAFLIDFFKDRKNLILELKTKSDCVDHLLELEHKNRTLISFSLNPAQVVQKLEFHTASLEQRLVAARKVLDAGYQVAFNLDPVIYYPGWKRDYDLFLKDLCARFQPGEIAFLHIGLLRHTPGLDGIVRQRFPGSDLFDQEFVQGPDKKYRYSRPVRDEMYGFLYERLKDWDHDIPAYSCVEKSSHWRKFSSLQPSNVMEVQDHVLRRVRENASDS